MKSIDTFSELAVSDFVLYSSWPPELASSFRAELPELELDVELVAGVSDAVEELVAGGVSDAVEEELLLELPQPARTITPISRDRTASAGPLRRGFD